ncbi:MAG: hypothetical protein JXR84_23925 [Anaerolineae bacterium]|nr:hypothetical protein [Anaerolineae bacterium]
MTTKQNRAYLGIMFLAVVLCTSCSGSGSAGVVAPITVTPELALESDNKGTKATGNGVFDQSSETSADIVLPVTRQVPPPEIQAQVKWFDGGATWELPVRPNTPHIDISNESISDRTLVLHYSNFEPGEIITTVLYTGGYYAHSEYFTSWISKADLSGKVSMSVFIPEEFCTVDTFGFNWLLYAAIGENPRQKDWSVDGWGVDLFASTVAGIELDLDDCGENTISCQGLLYCDSSSRFLRQFNLGTVHEGEGQFGTLNSKMEAHNWNYVATAGVPFVVQTLFFSAGFPTGRIGILDPEGNMVYECMDPIRGCYLGTPTFTPSLSGNYAIRIDAYDEEEITYFIRVVSKQNTATVSEITIDDSDPSALFLGPSEGWRIAPYGYDGSTHWTYCTNEARSNWAIWIPMLIHEGYYEVSVFIPEHNAGTTQATYEIYYDGSLRENDVTVRQADYANEWVSLGMYWFAAEGKEYVSLADHTDELRSSNTTIAFDAVRFVYVP